MLYFQDAATSHNKSLNKQIISVFIDKMRTGIGKSCLEEHRFTALFLEQKLDALKDVRHVIFFIGIDFIISLLCIISLICSLIRIK